MEPKLDHPSNKLLTVPNALSLLRLAGVPLFLWLLLGMRNDLLALVILVISGITDWLDGKLARYLNQISRLGALLDPVADRLYIMAALIGLALRDIAPWWLAVILIGRDVIIGACFVILRRAGFLPPEVHYIGKAATLGLLYALPLLLLAQAVSAIEQWVRPVGYAFTIWGTTLYLWAGVLYAIQVVIAMRARNGVS